MKQPIRKIAAIGLAALGAAASVRAEISLTPAYDEPTLEITVADGETTLGDWLAENGKTLDGVKTLVKKGAGRLSSTSDISATFGGDIVVEEGVFSASRPGALGADTGAVYVQDGAQYLVDPADGYENATFSLDGKPLVVAGLGPSGDGAIRHMAKYYVTRALGDIYLTADALLVIAGEKGDIRHSKTISCNGKTLTVRSLSSPRWGFIGNSWVRGPGTFVPDCVVMLGGDGGFTNGVEVVAGRELQSWGSKGHSDSTLHIPESGAVWKVAGNTKFTTSYNRWDGTVQLDGPFALTKYAATADYASEESVTFAGPVHGVGSFVSGGSRLADLRDGWTHLHLMNGANDFQGGVVKVGGSVNLYAAGALPRDGGALVLSNSVVTLHGDGAWSLPDLHVVGTGLVTTATSVVPNVSENPLRPTFTRGSVKSVVKEGAGDLVVNSAYATPLLDVREGTVSLAVGEANAYGPSGLVAGYRVFGNQAELDAAFASEELYATGVVNRVTISDTQPGDDATKFNAQHAANSFWTYSGYIWNRAETAQTWTFLLKQNAKTQLYIDGKQILEQEGEKPKVVQKEMTPGAHRFVLRMGSGNGWAGTSNGSVLWADRMKGFCIDFNGGAEPELKTRVNDAGTTESYYDFTAYTRPMDDGSGSLFTLTDDPLTPSHTQLAVATLRGLSGAVVNANGVDQQVDELVGYPTVKNGGLRVANAYRLEGAMAPGCAKVEGTLTFAEGCAFSVDDAKALRQGVRAAGRSFPCVIAEATKIVGCPVPASAEWEVSVDATGTKLILDRKGPGLLLLIR